MNFEHDLDQLLPDDSPDARKYIETYKTLAAKQGQKDVSDEDARAEIAKLDYLIKSWIDDWEEQTFTPEQLEMIRKGR